MLKDWLFYPLAALTVLGMVIFALSFAEEFDLTDCEIWTQGYVMTGEDLSRLTAQPGTQAEFVAQAGEQPAYSRLTSTVARETLPSDKPGIFAPLGVEYERAFATQRLRLTIAARSSANSGLDHFDMGYFSAGSGDSPWIRKNLTKTWKNYVMDYRPGALTAQVGLDHFSMWPGETGELLSMDVREMRVKVLDPPSCKGN